MRVDCIRAKEQKVRGWNKSPPMLSLVLRELLECRRYQMSDPKRIPSKLIFDLG